MRTLRTHAQRAITLFTMCFATACGVASEVGMDGESPQSTLFNGGDATKLGPSVPGQPKIPGATPSTHPTNTNGGATTADEGPMPYRGINLAGAEFGNTLPGKENVDYQWPTNAEVDYYVSKGMNTFRVGFKWERLQPKAYGELDAKYLAKLDAIVSYATGRNAKVILNPHNFARYYGDTVGSSAVPAAVFADLWARLATRYGPNALVMFNLVNEPNTIKTEQWVASANAAIAAIRGTGARNLIHVPGNGWTGAHSWADSYYGTPNSVAMLDIVDPIDNLVFEVHQYLDATSGGTSDQCVSKTIGSERMATFVAWLRAHGKKGFVGEFAGGRNPTCNAAVQDMLSSMMDASDVLTGWLWWAGGPGWGEYPFSLEPKNGKDQAQMSLLLPHLAGLATTPRTL